MLKPFADVDECSVRSHDCSKNAECLNIEGGYNCQCSIGYTGNGKVCEGIHHPHPVFITKTYRCKSGKVDSCYPPSALPDVREPEEQKTGDSGSNLGLISGVTVAGFLVVATLLIIGFLCALKIRKHSKSMKVPLSINVAFGKPNHNLPALSESTNQTSFKLYCKKADTGKKLVQKSVSKKCPFTTLVTET